MAESSPPGAPPGPAMDSTPLKVEDEAQQSSTTPSHLPPEVVSAKPKKAPAVREQREKKDSLKKREAQGVDAGRSATPDGKMASHKSSKKNVVVSSAYPELQRYVIEKPKPNDFKPPAPPVMVAETLVGGVEVHQITEHVHNKRGFRYKHAIADPEFPHTNYTRQTEVEPFCARFDYEDSSSGILFSKDASIVSTDKGFRLSRANVGLREGRWFWELKVISGIKDPGKPTAKPGEPGFGGHIRAGISRREASLEHPCGFDSYSYAIRDAHGQKIHMSSPEKFFPSGESICQGDVVGFELQLPSIALHRKVVEGTYNKAVDVDDEMDGAGLESVNPKTLLRDRYPIRYKNELYHEHYDYQPTKELEERFLPPAYSATVSTANTPKPSPNHPSPALRTLPNSYLKVYKNGLFIGTAFENLLAFLPPASKPSLGVREGLDDGTVGYYPSIGLFQGGAVQANFGPSFAFPPPEQSSARDVEMADTEPSTSPTKQKRLRPVSERYDEQIAEDIVLDIIDEVDCWFQDGGDTAKPSSGDLSTSYGLSSATKKISEQSGGPHGATRSGVGAPAEAIKELVQDDE